MPKKNEDTQWGEKLEVKPSGNRFKKTSALEDGQSIEGTLLAIKTEFVDKIGKEVTTLVMEDAGKKFELSPSGTINDAIRNNQLQIGTTYKFQKEGVTKTKNGFKGKFGIYPSKTPPTETTSSDI